MRRTKFQRVTAFVLALVFLLCSGTVVVGAASSDSVTSTTTKDIRELLSAISYSDYIVDKGDVKRAVDSVTIDAINAVDNGIDEDGNPMTTAKTEVVEYDGVKGLLIPSLGTVSWTTDKVAEIARYNIAVKYYPVENKAASIERVFMINGDIPFSEARYMTITKNWKNTYPDAMLEMTDEDNPQTYLGQAAAVGMTAEKIELDGKTYIKYKMPQTWTPAAAALSDELGLRFFEADVDENEIRSSSEQAPKWMTYTFIDPNGFYQTPFEFVITPVDGKVTLSMESVNEPIVISEIYLLPPKDVISYADYAKLYADAPEGTGKVKIEGEYFSAASSQTIYPISDGTSAITSPASTSKTLLNTVGGDKWQTPGQWVEYTFSVSESGMYQITSRFKQAILDGMYTSRMLYIYSEEGALKEGDKGYYDGLPFAEAARLQFDYSSDWQSGVLNDGTTDFSFYFEKDVAYTLRFGVSLGNMGDVVRRVQASLDSINNDYLNILKLTGNDPDENADYGFARVLPDTMIDMIRQSKELYAVSEILVERANVKGSMTATLEKVARLLDQMGRDESEIAKNLDQLKTYIGSLGTWLSDAKTQPLIIDYLSVQPASEELPEANANFWQAFTFEIMSFVKSFFRNYNRMGAISETTDAEAVEVWLAYGRDQSQVVRGLINNDFTPSTGVTVDLKLVAASTLLPSILAGMGPDVYIGLSEDSVINYAIRGALTSIENMEGFDETIADFNDAAMIVLGIEDSEGVFHTYGLPETQSFSMMFVREDILAELNIDIPKTWDDVKEAIPVLQANNMMIGMNNDVKIFLYQSGGELFADGGMRINLDSNVALEAFDTMCSMYTMYSFPYKYDFENRFRTGEMPIGFASYTATYNKLKVFATEIEGLWGFYPMPGYYLTNSEGEVYLNNVAVSTTTAIVMITGCEKQSNAWEFMKWHAGAKCQEDYSNEMVAILGPSAKHATANESALESLPWTAREYEQLALQFNNLASVPNYPGSYIIGRYTNFAFLDAYNDNADPATAILGYITTINKEITRKRAEFGLETLDYVGQTLAQKRMTQAEAELKAIREGSSYDSAYDGAYNNVMNLIAGYETEDYASLRALATTLEQLNGELFGKTVKYLRDAADALQKYEASK